MSLPLFLWYSLRTGHVARGVSATGRAVRVHARLDADGRAEYVVGHGPPCDLPPCSLDGRRRATTSLGNHSAVFYGDSSLCDFLYANGLDPMRLEIDRGVNVSASGNATPLTPSGPSSNTPQTP